MLRLAISRPQNIRWTFHNAKPSGRIRHASSKPTQEHHRRKWPPRISWPSTLPKPPLAPMIVWTTSAFLLAHLWTTYFFTISPTWGISMLPTLPSSGGYAIISKLYRRGRYVEIGDVVSFHHPVDQDVHSIKRVVGLEGDWVCRDTPGVGEGTVIQIPQGHCWVVGDNLTFSRDSRIFGPIPMALIKGKVLAQWFPWTNFAWVENGLKPALQDENDLD